MVFNDIFNISVWLMINSDKEFEENFSDLIMDVCSEAMEKIKKDRTMQHFNDDQLVIFKRREKDIELQLDTDYKSYLFQCDKLDMSVLEKLPIVKFSEPFDLEKCGIHVGKLLVKDKKLNHIYSYFYSLVKSKEQYHIVFGKVLSEGKDKKLNGLYLKSFFEEEVKDIFKNIKNIR